MNGSLRLGQPPEYGDAVGFYRLGKTASLDQIHNVYNIPAQTVAMVVVMSRSMVVVMGVLVVMVMVLLPMVVVMAMMVLQPQSMLLFVEQIGGKLLYHHIHIGASDARLVFFLHHQFKFIVDAQAGQSLTECRLRGAGVQKSAHSHVPADAGK